jgi:hypothetical protein
MSSFAQTFGNTWYFGNRCGLDFSSGSPVPLLNSQMYAEEGCATVTDANGNLLFYSNGDSIWNSSHALMPNGTGLSGQTSCSQAALALKKPGNNSIYYLFTIDAQGNSGGLCWSEIDMSLNTGLGDVTANKNVPLLNPSCEKLAAVRHSNGIDVWVVAHGLNSNSFYSYLITGTGIGSPVISNAGTVIASSSNNIETIGCMRISCGGNQLAIANYGNYEVQLFDFNTFSGAISNAQTLNSTYRPYGVEFSPNGNYLYISEWNWSGSQIYQYDLSASNIAQSQTSAGTIPTFGVTAATLQLGPDHKIYVAVVNSDSLSIINAPDQPASSCNFVAHALYLNGRISMAGLPNFVTGGYCIPTNPDGIELHKNVNELLVFPNPAKDAIRLEGMSLKNSFSVSLYNSMGAIVHYHTFEAYDNVEIAISGFSCGLYTIVVQCDGEITSTKFTVE